MAKARCLEAGCSKPSRSWGLCIFHAGRAYRAGTARPMPVPTTEERFWAKVDKTDACWLWTAAIQKDGYGTFRYEGIKQLAHRAAYQILVGPIPDGLVIDHLCRVRNCVRPSHLEVVTNRENVLRGVAPSIVAKRMNVCLRGHEMTPENQLQNGAGRTCRTCAELRWSRRRKQIGGAA